MLAEYEGMNVVDEEHEELMRSVAAVVYGGEYTDSYFQ